jgi:hypothetical protein
MAVPTFTLVGDLSTYANAERAGGYGFLVIHGDPASTSLPSGAKVLVQPDPVAIASDGTFTMTLAAIPGVTYRAYTSPSTLFKTFTFAAQDAGTTHDLSELLPVAAASSTTPYLVGPKGDTGPQGDTGDTGPQGIQGLKGDPGDPTAYELRGTGSPEGVVTAAVGTYYTDTAGTVGAWRWLKKSGAGNTGWAVVTGDTGWRNFGSELVNGFTAAATCLIRRTGDNIYFLGRLNATAATSNVYWTIPTGFRYQGGSFTIPVNSGTIILRASPSFTAETASRSATFDFMWQWATVEQWPSTLPGIAG